MPRHFVADSVYASRGARMVSKELFDRYILALRTTAIEDKTEHTDRAALQSLLQEFADKTKQGIKVQHEPKRVAEKGAPDFKVSKGGLILGYVENKGIDENLTKVLKSEQIAKYKSLSSNIILTDYLDFVWINKYGPPQRERLCHATDLENRRFRLGEDRVEAVASLLSGLFSSAPEGIGRAQQLALALATRSRLLRDYLGEELVRQEREHKEGRLYGLFQVFRDQVFHELTLKEFADALAQMLAYGLFLARLNSDSQPVTLHNAREYVPGSFRLIRELVDFLNELEKDEYRDVRWVVEEVLSIVNGLNLPAIHEDLSFRQRKAISRKVRAADEEEHRLFERDPFIYFYEDYLRAYDKETSKSRGVYYTPPPIVNFIVRAIDDILKDRFSVSEGLADHQRVTVLDFACGTGTFLLEVFQQIFENIGGVNSGKASLVSRDHMLTNVFGFEYLIAPYTIAHLKLSQFLADRGHPLTSGERLQVFLTNTLEPVEPQKNLLLPAVSAEVEAAQRVKEKPILVITGNPPYSGRPKNKGEWISNAISEYKFTWEKNAAGLNERKPLGERNPKWLQDDYVKFVRFAQMKMDGFTYKTTAPDGKPIEHSVPGVEQGIVGVITNHSWLDNPTFRGMRQSLMRSFEQIYLLDLHGNAKKKERAPDKSDDQNVFDIEQGVAIALFVKKPGLERGVWRGDLWGKRLIKYARLAGGTLRNIEFSKLDPIARDFLFIARDPVKANRYAKGWPLNEVFREFGAGIVTAHDEFSTDFSCAELEVRFERFRRAAGNAELLHREFDVAEKEGWDILKGWQDINKEGRSTLSYIRPIVYSPFDLRFIFYDDSLVWRTVRRIMDQIDENNVVLLSSRITKDDPTALVVSEIYRHKSATRYDITYGFPMLNTRNNVENFSQYFRSFVDERYPQQFSPEEILGHIYAVLNAPSYRTRYAEFLRIDFPRVPFPESSDDFESLSELGWELVQAHLLRQLPRRGLANYHGKGDHTVEAVRYSPQEQAISINKTQFFKPVPQAVWDFHVGGYQVLDKYLKSRKGRKLSLDEINHVAAVADSLAFTVDQMAKIDSAYREAFPEQE